VLSTVNVVANNQPPTLPELRKVLSDSEELDRTSINSWEDVEFRRAVEATGRKKLIMTALWTEVCLAFPALDAMRAGYEVFPVVDAVGGTSPEAHRAGLERIVRAGAQPIGWVSMACELQRDWARVETVPEVVDIVITSRCEWPRSGNSIPTTRRGVAALPVVTMPSAPFQPRDKVPPVARFAAQRPAVWIDDLHPAEAWTWSTGRHEPTLLIPVAPATGLTRQAVDQALIWARQLARPAC
jgi:hypothetical protein